VRNLLVVPSRTQGGLRATCQKARVDDEQKEKGKVKGDYDDACCDVEEEEEINDGYTR